MFDIETPERSNVVGLNAHRNIKEQSDDGIFFPVKEVPLADLTGKQDNGEKAVIRTDTDQIVAVNGKRYSLTQNEKVFRVVDEAIKRAQGLNTDGLRVEDEMAYNGGLTVRNYVFPNHKVEVGKLNDITEMRITVVNSYNGGSNLKMLVGGFRLICLNGMVAGTTMNRFQGRHTSGLDLVKMEARLTAGIKSFDNMGEMWKRYSQTPCSDGQAMEYIAKMKLSKPLSEKLFDYWLRDSNEMGKTLWALYNALTYYSTHHDITRGRGNEAATVLNRESAVSKVVNQFKVAA